ncbi:oligosaccharide flippase family protein [Aliiglaciecola sp. LCG003]|uniref:lipopolysaccharide biosynthesis protein n=1 Tax=Aliiglaciecola sp. LCG003 TaxID=3053655 RepID=UPI0025726358|nr:oligosaccharide flippase family protein [Aliiglaciecola sp. LCG003]WJG09743.1 oligosaccharide flippase family protein [Aliiglaciecola sp. LCG003]
MSEMQTIAKFGQIYTLGNLVNRSAGFLLIPLYTYTLTLEEYGLLAILLALTDILSLLFGFGFTAGIGRFYFDVDSNSETATQDRQVIVSTVFIGVLLTSIFIGVAAYPLSLALTYIIFNSTEHSTLFMVAIWGLIFTILFEVLIGYITVQKKAWLFFSVSMCKAVLFISLNIGLVYFLELGVLGIVYASFISMASISIVGLVGVFKQVGFQFSYPIFIDILKYSLPLVPSAVSNAGMTLAERFFLNLLAGPAAVGAYALACKLASLLRMFIATPFSQIFFVRRFESLAANENQQEFHKIFLIFVGIMASSSLFLSLFSIEIIDIIAPKNYSSVSIMLPLIGLSLVVASINQNIELGILFTKKTWAIASIGIVSFILCLPSNWLFIGEFGVLGAVYSLVFINLARLLLTVWANHKIGTQLIQLDWGRTAVILLFSSLLGMYFVQPKFESFDFQTVLLKLIVGLAFVFILLFSNILDHRIKYKITALFSRS